MKKLNELLDFFKDYKKLGRLINFNDHLLAFVYNLIENHDFRNDLIRLIDEYNEKLELNKY